MAIVVSIVVTEQYSVLHCKPEQVDANDNEATWYNTHDLYLSKEVEFTYF